MEKRTNKQLIHQYSQKLWNFSNKTFCDGFNGDITEEEYQDRIKEFKQMLSEFAERIEKNTKNEIF